MAGNKDTATGKLFAEPQSEMFDESEEEQAKHTGPKTVECLGMNFDNEEDRRAYFLERLKEQLEDPKFRATPGFPKGTDETILRMSDPPHYTACPNPFLSEFIRTGDMRGVPDTSSHREPLTVDVSEGKSDPIYKLHRYHTKIPYFAIVPSILHYTKPGELVVDGFCGSGMTGVAAQWCGQAPMEFRSKTEADFAARGDPSPEWGARRVLQGDLSPAASFISANVTLPFPLTRFADVSASILDAVGAEVGWMFAVEPNSQIERRFDEVIWGESLSCPECGGEIAYVILNDDGGAEKRQELNCDNCGAHLVKRELERLFEMVRDPLTGAPWKRVKLAPICVKWRVGRAKKERSVETWDLGLLRKIAELPLPPEVPDYEFPTDEMYHGSRLAPKGFTHWHHLYFARTLHVFAAMWRRALQESDERLSMMLRFWIDSQFLNLSIQNQYRPDVSFPYSPSSGVYYVPSAISEADPFTAFANKRKRILKAFAARPAPERSVFTTTGDCAHLPLTDNSADFVFTDPPFGANIPYADLNLLAEIWHGLVSDVAAEAIVDKARGKNLHEYQELMSSCFSEYYRVLKPGRWMTVVFSNSSNAVWRAIQEAIGTAGFVVADVRSLDKQTGSFRQVTSTAVKQDLVISAYKPNVALEERFELGGGSEEGCWQFVSEHLKKLPVALTNVDEMEVVAERTPQLLQDRMIAFHVQRGLVVPVSTAEFLAGLDQKYPERDGMYFLAEQIPAYDKKRSQIERLQQLSLFVNDEATAIQWVRQELAQKPRSFQDLQPQFMREQNWAKHELMIELRDLLNENFLLYDGTEPVPPQIHSYLSTNFKECRRLKKTDPTLKAKAADRWYVPDPGKQGDLETLRSRKLLAEFDVYKTATQKKLKEFRTEAVRAGFKAAYDSQEYETIVRVGAKLPPKVLQEDEKLLMYYDVASTRLGA